MPGPYKSIGTSGNVLLTSFQLLTELSATHIEFNSSTVKHVAQSFEDGITTDNASIPTCTSKYFVLFSSHSATSLSFIALDAFDIIVSPGQNFLKPPPVPETPTEIFTSGFKMVNSSATA